MPILIVAVLALGAFGIIGGLLAAATMLEHKKKVANNPDAKTLS
jgi:membrane associated rhomboid family serine protease